MKNLTRVEKEMMLQELTDEKLLNLGSSIGIGGVMIAISLIALQIYLSQRTRGMLYFFLAWTSFGLYIITSGMAGVFGSVELLQIAYVLFLPISVVLWLQFVDETMHEGVGLKKTVVVFSWFAFFSAFVLLETWTYDPINVTFVIGSASSLLNVTFFQMTNVSLSLPMVSYAYWSTISYRKSPPQLKSKTRALFIYGILMLVAMVIQFVGDIIFLLVQSIIVIIVIIGTTTAIRKTPMIAHLLPYTVYKLIITSKNGPKYYVKQWVEAGIDDDMLAGLMSAIGTVVKNTLQKIKTGAISEIKMYKGMMLTEMRYLPVNIVIIASKASTALKQSLYRFSEEFMKLFYNDLYDKDGFAKEVMDSSIFTEDRMDALIEKYFHFIPTTIAHKYVGVDHIFSTG